jgi:hypothetical protein
MYLYVQSLLLIHTCWCQAWGLLRMAAEAKLRAGLIPVPVMGMVAKCTRNTVNPIANGASTCTCDMRQKQNDLQTTQFNSSPHS